MAAAKGKLPAGARAAVRPPDYVPADLKAATKGNASLFRSVGFSYVLRFIRISFAARLIEAR